MTASATSSKELPSPRIGSAQFVRTNALGGFLGLAGSRFETRLPPHVHSSYVLGVVESGAVHLTTNRSSHIASAGMVVLLSPFVVHTEIPVSEQGWTFRYLYPTEAVMREVLRAAPSSGPALQFGRPVIDDPALAMMIRRVHQGLQAGDSDGTAADALAALVRRLDERYGQHRAIAQSRERRNIGAVRDLITERPLKSVKLHDLASAAGLSPFHFTRVFKNEVGLPPYAYYEQVRIAFAHQLIHEGHDLTSIAYQLGYADQSHLTRHFRRGSFTTPGRMAQLYKTASVKR